MRLRHFIAASVGGRIILVVVVSSALRGFPEIPEGKKETKKGALSEEGGLLILVRIECVWGWWGGVFGVECGAGGVWRER